jgi:hypothetical protein
MPLKEIGMVMHTCNTSTQKTQARRSQVHQPESHSEILKKKKDTLQNYFTMAISVSILISGCSEVSVVSN